MSTLRTSRWEREPRDTATWPVDRIVVVLLGLLGTLSLGMAVAVPIYAHTVFKPDMLELERRAMTSVSVVDRGVGVLERHRNLAQDVTPSPQSALGAAPALARLMAEGATAVRTTADAIDALARTFDDVAGVSMLVLAKDSFEASAIALSRSAGTFRAMAPQFDALAERSRALERRLSEAREARRRLEEELVQADVTLEQAHDELHGLWAALAEGDLAAEATRFADLQGGLYAGLGFLLWGLAGLWARLTLSGRPIRPVTPLRDVD